MFKIDNTKVHDMKVVRDIVQCSVNIDFHFDINGEKNIPTLFVVMYFDHTIHNGIRLMEKIKVVGSLDPVINTGQENDDFWLNFHELIETEIDERFFNISQGERNSIIKEIFKKVEDTIKTLEIEVED